MAGGYGLDSARGGAALAKMAYGNPYTALASILTGAAAQNIGGSADDSQRINQQVVTRGARNVNSEQSSPFGVVGEIGAQLLPGVDKLLPANTKSLAVGEASVAPQQLNVDSSQQPFSSKMQDYLNYMKYRS